jgi:hypothetical protein
MSQLIFLASVGDELVTRSRHFNCSFRLLEISHCRARLISHTGLVAGVFHLDLYTG